MSTPEPASTPQPTLSTEPSTVAPAPPAWRPGPDDRVAPLRGAGVQIDGRRIARVLLGLVLATLAVLVVVFTVIGIHNNRQIDQLRNQGVPVAVTVTVCQGLLGGSGSNSAGYSCRGTYELDGHRYDEVLPGTALHAPGTVVRARRRALGSDARLTGFRSSTPSMPRRRSSSCRPSCSSSCSPCSSCWPCAGGAGGQVFAPRSSDGPRPVGGVLRRTGASGGRRVALVRARPRAVGGPGAVALGRARRIALRPLERLLQAVGPDQVPGAGQQEGDAEPPEPQVEDRPGRRAPA